MVGDTAEEIGTSGGSGLRPLRRLGDLQDLLQLRAGRRGVGLKVLNFSGEPLAVGGEDPVGVGRIAEIRSSRLRWEGAVLLAIGPGGRGVDSLTGLAKSFFLFLPFGVARGHREDMREEVFGRGVFVEASH